MRLLRQTEEHRRVGRVDGHAHGTRAAAGIIRPVGFESVRQAVGLRLEFETGIRPRERQRAARLRNVQGGRGDDARGDDGQNAIRRVERVGEIHSGAAADGSASQVRFVAGRFRAHAMVVRLVVRKSFRREVFMG